MTDPRTEQAIQRVMALADEHANALASADNAAMACDYSELVKVMAAEAETARAALLAEVTALADWGEPVAWRYRYHPRGKWHLADESGKRGSPGLFGWESIYQEEPLYVRKQP
jgi:hypothetical protein